MQSKDSETKGLFKHALNYFGGNISVQALAFFSIPILTRLLSQSDYGMISVYMSYTTIMGILLTLNFHTAIGRYYFEIEKKDFKEFVGTSMMMVLIVGVLVSIILILLRNQIIEWLSIPIEVFWGLLIISPMLTLQHIFKTLKNITIQSRPIMFNTIAVSYGRFVLTILFIYLVTRTFRSRIYADITIFSITSIYYIKVIREYFKLAFKVEHLKYIFIYSIPLIPHSLSSVILHAFDAFMINSISGSVSNALYSIAYTIGMLSFIVYQSFHTSGSPFFNRMMAEHRYEDAKNQARDLNKIMLFFSVGISLFGVYAGLMLTSSEYYSAFDLIPVVVVGYFFMASYQLYGRIMFFEKKTYFVATTTLLAGICNIVLNAILIPRYGYKMAAYSTAFSFMIAFLVGWMICVKILKNKGALRMNDFMKSFVILFVITSASILTTQLSISHVIVSIIIKTLFMLILIRLFFMNEIIEIYKLFAKRV